MSAALKDSATWEASIIGLIWKQKVGRVPDLPPHIDLSGQTAVVTGSNSGIGLECSREFLKLGLSHLVLAVRSQSKGDVVASQLRADFSDAKVEVSLVDMESYESVQSFATRCQALEQLDIAVLNAGLVKAEFTQSGSGHETTIQVNYLSTALLALLLVPTLKAKAGIGRPGRLTFVGSDTGLWAQPESIRGPSGGIISTMDNAAQYDGFDRYGRSKALIFMFLSKLAEVVPADDVIINAVNPSGVWGTGIGREASGFGHHLAVRMIDLLFSRDLVEGTRKYLHTTVVLGKESHGSIADHVIRP